METKESIHNLWATLKRYVSLRIEYAKLTTTEKLTVLLSAVAVGIVLFVLLMAVVFFASLALAHLIGHELGDVWGYAIIGMAYLLIAIALFLLRKQLIINPISKFISKLFW